MRSLSPSSSYIRIKENLAREKHQRKIEKMRASTTIEAGELSPEEQHEIHKNFLEEEDEHIHA